MLEMRRLMPLMRTAHAYYTPRALPMSYAIFRLAAPICRLPMMPRLCCHLIFRCLPCHYCLLSRHATRHA